MRVGKEHDVDRGEVAYGQCGRGQAFGSDRKTGESIPIRGKRTRSV